MNYNDLVKSAYFIASLRGKKKYESQYKLIEDVLVTMGMKFYSPISDLKPGDASEFSDTDYRGFLISGQKKIKEADVFIAEITTSSSNVGYEVGYAVANNKPVLLLKYEMGEDTTAPPFRANPSKLLNLALYNEKSLKKKVEQFLKKAEKGIFVKRLPIEFTRNQVEYIEYKQDQGTKRISFNAAVRNIIEKARELDNKFKA